MADLPRLISRTGRASICTTARRVLAAPAPRRNSMIPSPSVPSLVQLPSISSSFPLCQVDMKEDSEVSETNCLPEQTHCDSPEEIRNGSKQLSTMLKRSLQKKVNKKSPLQQHMRRRGDIKVGMENVIFSIGNPGRIAIRVLPGNGRSTGMRETQQKQMLGEKERWNIRTLARTPI